MDQKKVGQFLKTLRNEKSITQSEIAEKLNVSNRSISRWENGITMPDFDLLIELSKYYGVGIDEILDGERKNKSSNPEEIILKVNDYNSIEYNLFSKRIHLLFILGFISIILYAFMDFMGLQSTKLYEFIISCALGFASGTLLVGILYTSRYMSKLKTLKMRLYNKFKK